MLESITAMAFFGGCALRFLATTASELSVESLDDGAVGSTLLHAALHPCAVAAQLTPQLAEGGAAAAAGSGPDALLPEAASAAARALIRCLSSPRASSETVTLCMVGLCLCHGCGGMDGLAVPRALVQALRPQAAEGSPGGEEEASALAPALSSGFLGLLNALSSRALAEEQACLEVALREGLALFPLQASRLSQLATSLLTSSLYQCAEASAVPPPPLSASAEGLPSPLLARATAAPRLLYASDAKVAVDIALRAVADVQEEEGASWCAVLKALQQTCCPEYRKEEVAGLLPP